AHIHPLNYALGLADAVEELKGSIFEFSEAIDSKKDFNNKIVVTTKKGKVIADRIVIATNGYSGEFHSTIKRSIVPFESIMIATEGLPNSTIKDIIKKDRVVSDSKELLYYFRRTSDNRLAFGTSGRVSKKQNP